MFDILFLVCKLAFIKFILILLIITKVINMSLKKLKELAAKKDKKILYNRVLGGYQVCQGFFCSEPVYAARNEKGRLVLDAKDLSILKSYI